MKNTYSDISAHSLWLKVGDRRCKKAKHSFRLQSVILSPCEVEL